MTRSVSTTNTLLLISSQKTLIKKLTEIVSSQFPEYTLEVADSGVKGLTRIYQSPPTVILVDSTLSDISGLQICRILKHDPTIRKVPIMLITRDEPEEYQRFSELSTIADVFLESKHLLTQFSGQFKMLVSLYTAWTMQSAVSCA